MKKKHLIFKNLLASSILLTTPLMWVSCSINEKENVNNEIKTNNENEEPKTTNLNKETDNKEKAVISKPIEDEKPNLIDLKQKFLELKNEIENFINNELNDISYTYYKDILVNFKNELELDQINKITYDENELEQKINSLELLYKNAKENYLKLPRIQMSEEDLKSIFDDKNSNSEIETNNDYENNLKTNLEANLFMNLVDSTLVKDYSSKNYTANNKKEIIDFTKELTKDAKTENEVVRTIFTWIVRNVKYAHDLSRMPALEPQDVLHEKFAVCGGYSNLYKAMLDAVGIKNSIVIGWSKYGHHQWNLVYNSQTKQYYHSDATFNYFNLSDEKFAKDHRTFKIIDVEHKIDDFKYEYNYGVSVLSSISNKDKPKDIINDELKVVSISEELLKKSDVVYVGKNIEKINYAGGLHKVKWFEVDPENKYYSSKDGILYNKNFTKLILVPENYENNEFTLPRTVRIIEDKKGSLKAKKLSSIKVEPGNFWFSSFDGILYNKSLSDIINIPFNKNKIILSKNTVLKEYDITDSPNFEYINITNGIDNIPAWTFNNLKNLKELVISESISKIENNAFNNTNIKNVVVKVSDKTSKEVIDQLNKIGFRKIIK